MGCKLASAGRPLYITCCIVHLCVTVLIFTVPVKYTNKKYIYIKILKTDSGQTLLDTIKPTNLCHQDKLHHFLSKAFQNNNFIYIMCVYVFRCFSTSHFHFSTCIFAAGVFSGLLLQFFFPCPLSLLPCCVLCCFVPLCSS